MLFGISGFSRFIQTTSILRAQVSLNFDEDCSIRFLGSDEVSKLVEQVRKRNVFARHSRENNFYVQRAQSLAEHTVIEIFRPGDPKTIAEEAKRTADLIEKITVLSTTLVTPKIGLLRKIGIGSKPRIETNLIIGPKFQYLRSRSRPAPTAEGIIIDGRFRKRFLRSGLDRLLVFFQGNSEIVNRVLHSLEWLYDSRTEPQMAASIVKSSIALESLLVFSQSESLAQSLSERVSFILSQDPSIRKETSRIIKRFYDVRSGIVHGSRKKGKMPTPSFLDAIDRFILLLYLIIASNASRWTSTDSLREWCESQRWGYPATDIVIPFPKFYLKNAVEMALKTIDQ